MRGKFITLEGIDGAGKSTHLATLIDTLRGRGITIVSTREPGGTPLGECLRELVLHQSMHLETETLLMFAARREHLDKVIEPALAAGDWVISDRFTDATFAYQGGGRGLAATKIGQLEQWVHPKLQPDLTLLFDLPPEVACERLKMAGNAPDKFEREAAQFFSHVRAAYLARAKGQPQRFRIIDASLAPDQVQKEIENIATSLCKL
jgi:dTMP kinase